MKKVINLLFLSAALLLYRSGFAQSFSLQQILDSINVRNEGLQQFDLKTMSDKEMSKSVKAWMAPTIGLGLNEFPYGNSPSMDPEMMPRQMLMLSIQQMFPNFSKQKSEAAWYQSFANQNKDDKATMRNILFAKAKMAYYEAFIAAKKLSLLDEQKKQLNLLIKISEGRLAYGKANLPDIYKTQAKLSDLESMQIKISSSIAQSEAVLNSLMNRPPDATLQIDTSINPLQQPVHILSVDSNYLKTQRSDIRFLSDQIYSLNLKQKIVTTEAKPVFGITWDNMRMPLSPEDGTNSMYMYNVMAMVSIPFAPWFSKGYKAKRRSLDYQIQATKKVQDNNIQEAMGNIRKDWIALQSQKSDLNIFQQKVIPAYAKTFQAYLNAFSENTGNIYETLMAWDDLTMKKMNYYDKLMELLNTKVKLEMELQLSK